jgi:spore coat protein A
MITRRRFLQLTTATGATLLVPWNWNTLRGSPLRIAPESILDPLTVPKYETQLIVPPAMPRSSEISLPDGTMADYYEITMKQFAQHILPPSLGLNPTVVWSYVTDGDLSTYNYPAFTIEAQWDKPVRVKWINGLVDASGRYRPHLFWIDQTVHWANPPGPPDMEMPIQAPYTGPVPMTTHVHGAHTTEESDGYPEAWYLPNANNIPAGYFTGGSFFEEFKNKFQAQWGVAWEPGTATFQFGNDQRATTLWYHDHSLGITRLNVYAGPAGFYLIRGGPDDLAPGTLPGPAPGMGDDPFGTYYEIPIVIQDRSFNIDGSLFYPSYRAFFEGLEPDQLKIPFSPDPACDGEPSDVAPIWNPEFFGNTIVVNGRTWPYLSVEKRRYRFRFLNGCNARFVILKLVTGDPTARPATSALSFWQVGTEGGFLPAPVQLDQLLVAPAERADVLVDFTDVPEGTEVYLINEGPDEPFGGGVPGTDFSWADPATTGQVIKFIVGPIVGSDASTDPASLVLPTLIPLGAAQTTRTLSLNEEVSTNVRVITDELGNVVLACDNPDAEIFGPTEALLGALDAGTPMALHWGATISEKPTVGSTETWEIYNFTADGHPIHVHLVQFQVVNRQALQTDAEGIATVPAQLVGDPIAPEEWETGFKDTIIAYPGQVARIKARFDHAGLFVWHCHILEHEDNEMMRPYQVVNRSFLPTVAKNSG